MPLAIAFRFEGGSVFRNVRPLEMLTDELKQLNIEHVPLNPLTLKHGSWNLVLVFRDRKTREKYESGELKYNPSWLPGKHQVVQRINPLKAAKRAAGRSR